MFFARRRKGILTLFILASFVIFCTWLIQIKFGDFHHHNHNEDQNLNGIYLNNINNVNKDNNIKLELNDRYHHDRRMLLLANTVSAEAVDVTQEPVQKDNFKLSRLNIFKKETTLNKENIELINLFKLLHHVNAFIADIDVLNEISKYINNTNDLKSNFEIDYFYFKTILKSSNLLQITFGIHPSALDTILSKKENFKSHYNLDCKLMQSEGTLNDKKILTNFYLNCTYVTIQLSVFYTRNEFIWIGKDDTKTFSPRWFGDTYRAINNFNITLLNTQTLNFFFVPSNIKTFLFDYNVSKFIECNRTLAVNNIRIIGDSYKQNVERNKMLLPVMTHISSTLQSLYKHYWLAGGTLLGWYRDCGIIPHTQDVDFAIWADEYDNKIKKAFLGNKIVRVWGTLGLVNDSFEFRMYNDLFTFDMFLVYKHNSSHNWCGYQVNKVKFRRWIPKFDELCSAELLNNKFMIPCDPVGYLNQEYGKQEKWITPQSSNYTWSNVNHWKSWSDDEWPHVIKYYDKSGNLIKSKILNYLNKHTKRNITQVPDDPD